MRKLKIFIACVFMVSSLGSLYGAFPASELGKWWKNSEIVRQLGLSDVQVGDIEQSYLNHRDILADLSAAMKATEDQMKDLMAEDAMDEAGILAQAERVAEARKNLEVANAEMMLSIRKELTAEQWKRLTEIQELSAFSSMMPLPDSSDAVRRRSAGKMKLASGEEVVLTEEGDSIPVAIYRPNPVYTNEAKVARCEGVVLLQAIIREDGKADSFKILRSLGYGLDESAIRTIAQEWRFKPAVYKGKVVDALVRIEISFRLY
jgi:TonB family protein